MTDLYDLHPVDAGENSVEKRNSVDNHFGRVNLNAIADIIGMLDKQEDARAKEFLSGDGEDEGEREEGSSGSSESSDEAALEEGEEDEDDKHKDNEEQDLIKDSESLANIFHALPDGLSFLANLNNLADHLIKTDVAIGVAVDGVEGLLGLGLVCGSEDFFDILQVEFLVIFHNKGHPDSTGEGFGRLGLLQGFENDRMSRVRVEDILSGDLRCDVTKDRSHLVSDSGDISNELHGSGRATALVTLLSS